MKTIILDPGHGYGNRTRNTYDSGAEAHGHTEAATVMEWANELREILKAQGHTVVRTRVDAKDPCPIGRRAKIAAEHGGDVMLSIHCNAANGKASGTETFYRKSSGTKVLAERVNAAVVKALQTKDRGVKEEGASQHPTLAVMAFRNCVLVELGFIDNKDDLAKMTNPLLRRKACEAMAEVLAS